MMCDLDDWYDDPNMYLPPEFITCFDEHQLPTYRQAIDVFASRNPQHSLDIDTSGSWNSLRQPALLCYDRSELKSFWMIFEALRLDAMKA
jgi:2'-5' RNA ligase